MSREHSPHLNLPPRKGEEVRAPRLISPLFGEEARIEASMLPGEILVARLSGGATIVRFREERNGRVFVLLGRNKVARIPAERVMLATGVLADEAERFEEFCDNARDASSEFDLSEVWDVLTDEQGESSLEDLADLYWPASPGALELTALLLCLEASERPLLEWYREVQAANPGGPCESPGEAAARSRERAGRAGAGRGYVRRPAPRGVEPTPGVTGGCAGRLRRPR